MDQLIDFELLVGFKNAQSLLFERDIKRWRKIFDVLLTVDQTCDIWGECVGLITEHIAELHLKNIRVSYECKIHYIGTRYKSADLYLVPIVVSNFFAVEETL